MSSDAPTSEQTLPERAKLVEDGAAAPSKSALKKAAKDKEKAGT